MAAGDLIAANLADLDGDLSYQVEQGGHLIGDGDPWVITRLDGLGDVENPTNTAPRSLASGSSSGAHVAAAGTITFTAAPAKNSTAAEIEADVAELEAAWTIEGVEWQPRELHLLAPGRGHVYVVGWPHTVKVTRSYVAGGVVSVVCGFVKTEVAVTPVEPMPS